MTDKRDVTKLLRLFLQVLEGMTDDEFNQLLSGQGRLKFFAADKKEKDGLKESSKVSTEELQALAKRLRESNSRDNAREILHQDSRALLRDNLEQLARMLKVHVNKHDKRDAIEDKIIESVIGVRLRTEAIQGLNLKGSGTSQER